MKVLSLFSGGGLGDYGLELAGFEIVGQVEIDEYCQKILALRWPDVPKWRDVRSVTGAEVKERCGAIDMVSGGFPCTDISLAGKGVGISGERSGLWSEMFRIICEIKPRYVLVENVTAIISQRGGLGVVLRDLSSIGFNAEWLTFRASDVGAPHHRDRFWCVAHTHSDRLFHSMPYGRFEKGTWGKKTFWSHYWNEVRSGYTGHEPIQSMEETKRKALDQPWLLRVADGPTTTLDRLKLLGNGQVVQVVQWIGERIMEFENK
jgi:DNA (cytosine-5)-methyltransferase 1